MTMNEEKAERLAENETLLADYNFEELMLVNLFRNWGWPEKRIREVMREIKWVEHPRAWVEEPPPSR